MGLKDITSREAVLDDLPKHANAVALCANCHRKMHILNRESGRGLLRKRILQRDRI